MRLLFVSNILKANFSFLFWQINLTYMKFFGKQEKQPILNKIRRLSTFEHNAMLSIYILEGTKGKLGVYNLHGNRLKSEPRAGTLRI